jgi:prepilin-type processing-associated H-X9-DG protein
LKQLGLALHNYADVHKVSPHGSEVWAIWAGNANAQNGTHLLKLFPYVEQRTLFDQIDFRLDTERQLWILGYGLSWYGGTLPNGQPRPIPPKQVPGLRCPSDTYTSDDISPSSYAGSMGAQQMDSQGGWCQRYWYPGGYFGTGPDGHGNTNDLNRISGVFGRSRVNCAFSNITDGTSNTIAIGEIRGNCSDHGANGWAHYNTLWIATTAPINFPTCPNEPQYAANSCNASNNWQTSQGFKSRHPGGAQFVLCDGSGRFLSETIDYATYQRLGDRRDGQSVGNF